MSEMPKALLAGFEPAAELLFHRARRGMDDGMLMEIARADYGQQAAEMCALLRPIRDSGIIVHPLHGQLLEVLQLTRWCDPDRPNQPPFPIGPSGLRGHQTRLFACAVLLCADAAPESADSDVAEDSTVAVAMASARVLGEDLSEALARFLTWWLSNMGFPEERLCHALALLVLAVRLRQGRFTDVELNAIAEWVLQLEAYQRDALGRRAGGPPPNAFSVQQGLWDSAKLELQQLAGGIESDPTRANLELCGLLLEPF